MNPKKPPHLLEIRDLNVHQWFDASDPNCFAYDQDGNLQGLDKSTGNKMFEINPSVGIETVITTGMTTDRQREEIIAFLKCHEPPKPSVWDILKRLWRDWRNDKDHQR